MSSMAKVGLAPPSMDFDSLYRVHFRYVWQTLRRLGIMPSDTADAAQEVFIVVHRKLATFDANCKVTTWLFAICYRHAQYYRRSASQLLRESALLEQGRRALRAGDTAGAWRTLQQLAAEFPAGQLVQEREALAIELLWRGGRRSEASERIRRFVRAYPNSAHAARLKALLAEPAP